MHPPRQLVSEAINHTWKLNIFTTAVQKLWIPRSASISSLGQNYGKGKHLSKTRCLWRLFIPSLDSFQPLFFYFVFNNPVLAPPCYCLSCPCTLYPRTSCSCAFCPCPPPRGLPAVVPTCRLFTFRCVASTSTYSDLDGSQQRVHVLKIAWLAVRFVFCTPGGCPLVLTFKRVLIMRMESIIEKSSPSIFTFLSSPFFVFAGLCGVAAQNNGV